MADEKIFEKMQAEIDSLKEKHKIFKDRVYELLELEQNDTDPYSVIEIVEFKQAAWARWQGWVPENIKELPKRKRFFNPQPKPEKGKKR